jgi:uroporphyrinogen decarboxylase
MQISRRMLIWNLIAGKSVERCGLWIGSPRQETIEKLNLATGTKGEEALHRYFDDDVRWITPQYMKSTYRHPNGIPMRYWKDVNPHAMAGGLLAGAGSVSDVDSLNWPDVQFLHFDEILKKLEEAGDVYRLSGFWSPFFHDLTYLFGTEELLIKMLVQPELVHRALEHLCNFYLEANELFFQQSTGLTDALFFGNDFGAQNDLLMAPEQFEEFFLPWIEKFAGQAHRFNHQVVLHSCGSVYRIMDQFIHAGINAIHPIQSKAANMDAEYLAQHYKGKIAFIGGIDTQDVLPNGSPESVYNEVIRVKNLLGNNIVIGPSHEALLPNVPFENVKAMCDAARARII